MIEKIYIPIYPLNKFIDHFLYFSGLSPAYDTNRFIPDGEVQLILDLTDYPKYIYDNHTLKEVQVCQKAWFSGFRTEPITIPSGRESEMIVIQFKKGKAFSFLNEPMNQVTNQVVDAEFILKPEILNIREYVIQAKTIEQKFKSLEKNLLKCYREHLDENPFIDFAINKIIALPNRCSIKEIVTEVGYSHKHIIELFRKHVGVTPKEFLKVIQFQKAIQVIEQNTHIDWSTIAFECGYYDQSHFICDFKKFSGFTPSEYFRIKGDNLNFVPIQ